jgi:hypothetical protein
LKIPGKKNYLRNNRGAIFLGDHTTPWEECHITPVNGISAQKIGHEEIQTINLQSSIPTD